MKITALEESVDFATLDTEKLFSKLKSHELSHKARSNHDTSFSSKALITGTRVGGHDCFGTHSIGEEFFIGSHSPPPPLPLWLPSPVLQYPSGILYCIKVFQYSTFYSYTFTIEIDTKNLIT
jgi:hypothetical protein